MMHDQNLALGSEFLVFSRCCISWDSRFLEYELTTSLMLYYYDYFIPPFDFSTSNLLHL